MTINDPAVLVEVEAAFARYEAALIGNDVAVLDALFWGSPHTIRYGPAESLYGQDEILAFRKARPSAGLDRTLRRTVITTFGTDFATANTEFIREGTDKIGRQSQSWVRMPDGWKVVAAHVSLREPVEGEA
ncbi:MAG: oxalurate catabolism protein HpxZ [Rhizobiales bacterium]|nr:oxalurate catabolism protein HpxZ [Hyphomicrobiales bacterium]MBO6697288.1 oxalurate catabolism protein HpxZ [Hyphomicrobiales bacterium]MBO6736457.1 oxalurate catabolism protein HpxZ [Hyphomicrobiales bacterium]MBO6912927.1 oxalurate catabolism protein HpxZ [Hyphomicrobiales bacterium]MBO6954095.1 oxalurate catabolism protein HpxZ [Hyphomicrobiales bacterium]